MEIMYYSDIKTKRHLDKFNNRFVKYLNKELKEFLIEFNKEFDLDLYKTTVDQNKTIDISENALNDSKIAEILPKIPSFLDFKTENIQHKRSLQSNIYQSTNILNSSPYKPEIYDNNTINICYKDFIEYINMKISNMQSMIDKSNNNADSSLKFKYIKEFEKLRILNDFITDYQDFVNMKIEDEISKFFSYNLDYTITLYTDTSLKIKSKIYDSINLKDRLSNIIKEKYELESFNNKNMMFDYFKNLNSLIPKEAFGANPFLIFRDAFYPDFEYNSSKVNVFHTHSVFIKDIENKQFKQSMLEFLSISDKYQNHKADIYLNLALNINRFIFIRYHMKFIIKDFNILFPKYDFLTMSDISNFLENLKYSNNKYYDRLYEKIYNPNNGLQKLIEYKNIGAFLFTEYEPTFIL